MTTATKTTAIFRTWAKRLESGTLTKALCGQFAAAITPLAMDERPGGKETALTADEAAELLSTIRRNPVRLTADHEAKGLAWLLKYGAKALGEDFPIEKLKEDFDHFEYDGGSRLHRFSGGLPEWMIVFGDGQRIKYSVSAWQNNVENGCEWRWARKVDNGIWI